MNLSVIKWSGTFFMTLSAVAVSFSVQWAEQWWAFVGFLIGHMLWTYSSVKMKEWALFSLNFSFIFVDIYAILLRT